MTQVQTITARLKSGESLGDRILKVDHAGEHGAVNIYRAQIFVARWRSPGMVADLRDMLAHEKSHRARIADRMQTRGVRRCRSFHLCGLGGIALGLITGILGTSAIHATTFAIEDVVLVHMRKQIDVLRSTDATAHATIATIIDDEQSHHDSAVDHFSKNSFWPRIIVPVVRWSTEGVIWLGMHL